MTNLDPDALSGVVVRVPEGVVLRAFEGETVLLNLGSGTYHGLNATGGRMLEVLQASADAAIAAATLAVEYEQPEARIRADLAQLCTELADRGLVEVERADD